MTQRELLISLKESTRREFLSNLGKTVAGAVAPKSIVSAISNIANPAKALATVAADKVNLDDVVQKILAAQSYYSSRSSSGDSFEIASNILHDSKTPNDVKDILGAAFQLAVEGGGDVKTELANITKEFMQFYKTGIMDYTVSEFFGPIGRGEDSLISNILKNTAGYKNVNIDQHLGQLRPIQFLKRGLPMKVSYTSHMGNKIVNSDYFGVEDELNLLQQNKENQDQESRRYREDTRVSTITIKIPRPIAIKLKTSLTRD